MVRFRVGISGFWLSVSGLGAVPRLSYSGPELFVAKPCILYPKPENHSALKAKASPETL